MEPHNKQIYNLHGAIFMCRTERRRGVVGTWVVKQVVSIFIRVDRFAIAQTYRLIIWRCSVTGLCQHIGWGNWKGETCRTRDVQSAVTAIQTLITRPIRCAINVLPLIITITIRYSETTEHLISAGNLMRIYLHALLAI